MICLPKIENLKALVDRDLFIISEDIVAVEIVDWELGGGDSRLITPSSSMLNWKFSNLLLFFFMQIYMYKSACICIKYNKNYEFAIQFIFSLKRNEMMTKK